MYSYFKSKGRDELISDFDKLLKRFPLKKPITEKVFRPRLHELVIKKYGFTKKESKELIETIYKTKVIERPIFRRRMYSYLKTKGRSQQIPIYDKTLKGFPLYMEEKVFIQRFLEKLHKNKPQGKKKSSKKILREIINWNRHKKKTHQKIPTLGKERFKYVTTKQPLQGGSPGLGKGKS